MEKRLLFSFVRRDKKKEGSHGFKMKRIEVASNDLYS